MQQPFFVQNPLSPPAENTVYLGNNILDMGLLTGFPRGL